MNPTTARESLQPILREASEALLSTLNDRSLENRLQEIYELVLQTLKDGKKILICGNGGSAAEAQHIAAEFVGRFKKDRSGWPSVALTTDTSILTAISNDYSFEEIFARQVEALGDAGDLLILLSTGGSSPNCVRACRKAKTLGVRTAAFTGKGGGELKDLADLSFIVPSKATAHIQEVHLVVLHAICERVEEVLSA